MKKGIHAPSVLAILIAVTVAVGTLAGCGSSTKAVTAPTGASSVYFTGDDANVEQGYVYGFPATKNGSAVPATTFTPPAGFYVECITFGPTGNIYVGGQPGDDVPEILVYSAGATSSSSPTATYTGGSGTFSYPEYMAVNASGQLFVEGQNGEIAVYAANAATGATPTQYITTLDDGEYFSDGIGADSAGNIYVAPNSGSQGIWVFAPGATGSAAPVRTITSTSTAAFTNLYGITADAAGNVFVVDYNNADDPFGFAPPLPMPGAHTSRFEHGAAHRYAEHYGAQARAQAKSLASRGPRTLPNSDSGIYEFAAGATGAAVPTLFLSGAATTIAEPDSIVVDAADNIYYADYEGGTPAIMVFAAGATGNVAPRNSISGSVMTYNDGPINIAAY